MIADIFFKKKIPESVNLDYYDESYLKYIISKELFINGAKSFLDLKVFLLNKYKIDSINYLKLSKFLNVNFKVKKNRANLKDDENVLVKQTLEFKETFFSLKNSKSKEELLDEFVLSTTNLNDNEFTNSLVKYMIYSYFALTIDFELIESKFYFIICNKNRFIFDIENLLQHINECFFNVPINLVFEQSSLLKLFYLNNILKVKDLSKASPYFLYILFGPNIEKNLLLLNEISNFCNSNLKEKIDSLNNCLNNNGLFVISKRNDFIDGYHTLENIGSELGLTRERVRQIESKATNILKNNSYGIKVYLYSFFYNSLKNNEYYLNVADIENILSSQFYAKEYAFLIKNSNLTIKYDEELDIIYDFNKISLEELKNNVFHFYGNFISKEKFESFDLLSKKIIQKNYKLKKSNIYIKKGLTFKDLSGYILDKYFPDGYKIGSDKDYADFKNYFNYEFFEQENFLTQRSIIGFIKRLDYCLVDKGTYLNRTYCSVIPDDLLERIINFILNNGPTVYYLTIFENFENELTKLNITNYFYLKGLLDSKLSNDFIAKKSYITFKNNLKSGKQVIIDTFLSYDGIFTLKQVINKFRGVHDYTISSYLYSEIDNGLLMLGQNNYVYFQKLKISNDSIRKFKEFIENLFKKTRVNTLSSRKIYAALFMTDPTLLSLLKIIKDGFSTFSLIRYIFKNDYFYHRPYVSNINSSNLTKYGIVADYAKTLNYFNKDTIDIFILKMNIGQLYSYLSFMEDMSEDFVQIDKNTMIKKELSGITDDKLKEIVLYLNIYISRYGELKTDSFSMYNMFPTLKYTRNKYLLVGIIRTYCESRFEVVNTTNFYDTTDFIIKNIKN